MKSGIKNLVGRLNQDEKGGGAERVKRNRRTGRGHAGEENPGHHGCANAAGPPTGQQRVEKKCGNDHENRLSPSDAGEFQDLPKDCPNHADMKATHGEKMECSRIPEFFLQRIRHIGDNPQHHSGQKITNDRISRNAESQGSRHPVPTGVRCPLERKSGGRFFNREIPRCGHLNPASDPLPRHPSLCIKLRGVSWRRHRRQTSSHTDAISKSRGGRWHDDRHRGRGIQADAFHLNLIRLQRKTLPRRTKSHRARRDKSGHGRQHRITPDELRQPLGGGLPRLPDMHARKPAGDRAKYPGPAV